MYIEKIREDVVLPRYGTEFAAGMDFFIPDSYLQEQEEQVLSIMPMEIKKIPLGIKIQMKEYRYLKLEDRSSWGSKGLHTLAGIVDSDYRGEVHYVCINLSNKPIFITPVSNKENVINMLSEKYKERVWDRAYQQFEAMHSDDFEEEIHDNLKGVFTDEEYENYKTEENSTFESDYEEAKEMITKEKFKEVMNSENSRLEYDKTLAAFLEGFTIVSSDVAICQGIVKMSYRDEIYEGIVDETVRGEGGFGSTNPDEGIIIE